HKPAGIPDQDLDAVAALAAIDDDRAGERVFAQHLLRQRGKSVCALTEIDWLRGQQDAGAGGNIDHGRDAEARTARNTAVNRATSSTLETTRTTAPASLTSITGAADAAACGTGAAGTASLTIGTKSGVTGFAVLASMVVMSWRAARRQPKTCCEQTCQRRATSDTRAPGTRVSSTIRAFSSADQRRRRPGPVRISTRRYSPFASSLTSNIRIARSPLPQAYQALRQSPLNKGIRGPLTANPAERERRQAACDAVSPSICSRADPWSMRSRWRRTRVRA